MPNDSEDDFRSEYDEDFPDENPSEIAEDDPRRDPVPGEVPARKPRAGGRRPAARAAGAEPRVTKRHRDEAVAELTSLIEFAALLWGMQAPPVGAQLEADAPDIAAKVIKIASRNPKWLMSLANGSVAADGISLLLALMPTGKIAWQHYTAPREGGETNGREFDPAQFPPYDPTGGGLPR